MKHIHYTIFDQVAPDEVDECIRKLFVAIVHRAILDLFATENTFDKREASFWLLESKDDMDVPFSFAWICHYLTVDKNKIASRLQHMLNNKTDMADPSLLRIFRVDTQKDDTGYNIRPVAPVHYARKNMPSTRKTLTSMSKLRQRK